MLFRPNCLHLKLTLLLRKYNQRFSNYEVKYYSKSCANTSRLGYAENFINIFQDEIQAAHWSYDQISLFTALGEVVACAPVMQRARVRSPVRTSFLGEVFFLGFSSPVRQTSESFWPQGPRISFGHHYHP